MHLEVLIKNIYLTRSLYFYDLFVYVMVPFIRINYYFDAVHMVSGNHLLMMTIFNPNLQYHEYLL